MSVCVELFFSVCVCSQIYSLLCSCCCVRCALCRGVVVYILCLQTKSIIIKLVSGAGTGFAYVTRKNPVNTPLKLKLMKYDPIVRKHVLFEEMRISRTKPKKKK